MSVIWAVICIAIVMINFLSNRLINTNCRFIYVGSIIIIFGSLVGLSSRPVIAGTIVFVGAVVAIWAAITYKDRHYKYRTLKSDKYR